MPRFVVVPALGATLVGAVDGGETRETAEIAALAILRRNKGMIFDVVTSENRPIDSILICEVVHEGIPHFSLQSKEAQTQQQPDGAE